MNGFGVYKTYTAVRAHFNSSYDYVKCHGKTRASVASYNKRNDKYYFEKFGRNYHDKEILPMFVSIHLQNPKIWVGDLNRQNHRSVYDSWVARLRDLKNRLKMDVQNVDRYLDINNLSFKELVDMAQLPLLYRLYISDKIMPETVLLYEAKHQISNESQMEDPVHKKTYNHLKKYERFIRKVDWTVYYNLIK